MKFFLLLLSPLQPCTTTVSLELEGWRILEQVDGSGKQTSLRVSAPHCFIWGSGCCSTGLIYNLGPLVKYTKTRRKAVDFMIGRRNEAGLFFKQTLQFHLFCALEISGVMIKVCLACYYFLP